MNKWLIIILLMTSSCIDFEFEAPYEDLNGIYIAHVMRYSDVSGYKLLFEGSKGYILKESGLSCYSFVSVDSIFEICSYDHGGHDFAISDSHAYITDPNLNLLLVINFQGSQPYLVSSLHIDGGAGFIRLHSHFAYITGVNTLSIIDINDKQAPVKVEEYVFADHVRWLEVDSNHAYILLGNSDFWILDISDPTDINVVSQVSVIDTLGGSANMFALRGDYLYFLKNRYIETYQQSENGDLEYLSRFGFASYMEFMHIGDNYGLACDGISWVYLLNLEYPSRPCITEIYELAWFQHYGIIRDNYIYLLVPYLEILEIKEVQ